MSPRAAHFLLHHSLHAESYDQCYTYSRMGPWEML